MSEHEHHPHHSIMGDPVPQRQLQNLRQRRDVIIRMTIIALITTAGMALFVVWYKQWPQRIDCRRAMTRIVQGLDKYAAEHHRLPAVLEELKIPQGRFSIEHYEYTLEGLGGRPVLRDNTVLVFCGKPHEGPFHEPGRHVLMFVNNRLSLLWFEEPEFRDMMTRNGYRLPGRNLPADKGK